MRAELRPLTSTPDRSFLIRTDTGQNLVNNWHYHPETELLFIKKSSGTWLIGDHIGHFQSGDIVLIGPGLPHCFRHEKKYTRKKTRTAGETICIKFLPEMFGDVFLNLPETKAIKKTLAESSCALRLQGKTKITIARIIEKILTAPPGKKMIHLLSILEEIAEHKEFTTLSSKGFMQSHDDMDKERIKAIFEYTFNHYHDKITINDLASLVNMTRESFCRYFKSKTKKTYSRFLMEVRIGSACRLLAENELNVAGVSYECGYNNISHFNHQFKFITGKKPLQYKKEVTSYEM